MPYNFGDKKDGSKNYFLCPVCGQEASLSCKCPMVDCVCPAGHTWHTDLKTNTVVEGSGHDAV